MDTAQLVQLKIKWAQGPFLKEGLIPFAVPLGAALCFQGTEKLISNLAPRAEPGISTSRHEALMPSSSKEKDLPPALGLSRLCLHPLQGWTWRLSEWKDEEKEFIFPIGVGVPPNHPDYGLHEIWGGGARDGQHPWRRCFRKEMGKRSEQMRWDDSEKPGPAFIHAEASGGGFVRDCLSEVTSVMPSCPF